MTDAEIVKALRGDDPKERQRALETLFPGEQEGALLIRTGAMITAITSGGKCNLQVMFTQLVSLAQQFGKHLNLDLRWVQVESSVVNGGPGVIRP